MNRHFIVTEKEISREPISPLLYGHFIELGYGIQVEPMWGEMFFNRSFERFVPYRANTVKWFDLWLDPKNVSLGYETDWRKFDWYHSGYEHNAWFAAPGEEGPFHIDDQSDFIIAASPVRDVEIRQIEGGLHGTRCLRIENREQEEQKRCGLGQQGKYFRKGTDYRFRGKFRNVRGADRAIVEFFPEGRWDHPFVSLPLTDIAGDFTEKEVAFNSGEFEGRASFVLWTPPDSVMEVDDFSLMPCDTVGGWRKEAVEAARRVNPKVIRWPGGCFASFYNWRDGIGPYSRRIPRPSYFWGGLNYNDVGTAELAAFAKSLGAESMICINMHHPAKRYFDQHFPDKMRFRRHGYDLPEFTDPVQGAKEAADWVAYCNAPVTHPMGKLRAEHGYPEPFGVKFWELDNETVRWFKPDEYAHACVLYAKAMKAVDPSIRTGMVTYGESFQGHLAEMMEIAGEYIDFFADRAPTEEGLTEKLQILREYNRKHNRKVKYCNTEWLATETKPNQFNHIQMENGRTKSYMFSKWRYAMHIFRQHMHWHRFADDMLFVNFNNFANTHSQCVIDTPKEGTLLTASGKAYELLSRTPAAWPLEISGYTPGRLDPFQVQAYWDHRKESLVLYVFNITNNEQTASFDLSILGRTFMEAQISRLAADDLLVMNMMECPETIRNESVAEKGLHLDSAYRTTVPPYSFTQVVLR